MSHQKTPKDSCRRVGLSKSTSSINKKVTKRTNYSLTKSAIPLTPLGLLNPVNDDSKMIFNQNTPVTTSTPLVHTSKKTLGSRTIRKKKLNFRTNDIEVPFQFKDFSQKIVIQKDSDNEMNQSDNVQLSQVTAVDLARLKGKIEGKKILLDLLEKHEVEKNKLIGLYFMWKKGGIEAAELLSSKLDPPQTVKDLLIQFGIPTKMFLND